MTRIRLTAVRAVALTLLTAGGATRVATQAPRPHADRIFVNGAIWTGDDTQPRARAVAIGGASILAVGSDDEVRALASPDTAIVDLRGRMVVPGFQDSHLHLPGASVNTVDLAGVASLREFQQRIADFARTHPSLPWITGGGWGYAAFPNQTVDKSYIDEVVADRPVYVSERDGHMGLANSKALEIAGVTAATHDPPNGHIMKSPGDAPTGELKEAAQGLVRRRIPAETPEDRYTALLQHMDEAAAAGITSVQDASTAMETLALFERAAGAGALKIRVRFAPVILPNEGTAPRNHTLAAPLAEPDLARYVDLRNTFKGPLLTFGAVKGVLDGTVDARTAAMFEPYVGGGTGIPFWEQADLNGVVALYDRLGFQVMLHAIGDKAINMALNAFEHAARANGTSGRRHRIEHAEVPTLQDLPRFKALGVVASTQAMFANPDATTLDNFAVLLGPARAAHADSFKLYDDAGAVQAFGSDWGVFPFAPLPAIYCAATRTTPQGTPAGGWFPAGRIAVEAALRHYTRRRVCQLRRARSRHAYTWPARRSGGTLERHPRRPAGRYPENQGAADGNGRPRHVPRSRLPLTLCGAEPLRRSDLADVLRRPEIAPEPAHVAHAAIEHCSVDICAREPPPVLRMAPARRLDGEDRVARLVSQPSRHIVAESADRIEGGTVGLPHVDLPTAGALVAQVDAPVQTRWQTWRSLARLIPEVHPMRCQERSDLGTEVEECAHIDRLANDVDIEIAPRHQSECVAADDVDVAVTLERASESRFQELIGFGADLVVQGTLGHARSGNRVRSMGPTIA